MQIDTSQLNSKELQEVMIALDQYGHDIGTMLDQLQLPADFVVAFADFVAVLEPEQMDDLYATLYQRCIEQKTAELVLAERADYQSELANLEQETADKLAAIIN